MTRLSGQRILVTGGSGFIASHLCHRLVQAGARVFVLTKYNSLIDNVRLAGWWERVTPVEADLRNLDSLKVLRDVKPQVIYHFAAYNHVADSFTHVSEAIDVNGRGTVNLLESYDRYARFVYISSSEVYGDQRRVPFEETATPCPISPYAIGKYTGELYAKLQWHVRHRPVVVLRPFNAFGPYQSPRAVIAELILACLGGKDVITTEGRQTRDFNYVENLVDGFLLAAQRKQAVGEVINLGSGREISIRELARMIHRLCRSRSRLKIGTLAYRPTEIWRMVADARKAKRLLGWSPRVSLEKGLPHTIAWYRKFHALFLGPDAILGQLWPSDGSP
ncbi:MAG: GDP-mannose 4,6-dehydratase [Candidatus Omnitrophica bacterium]|nr:GDP-mannose 4,6-dehydratase [Candidatus Omnitrophota bacterium]